MGLLEDIAGRTTVTEKLVPLPGVGPTQLCPANTQRCAVGFACPTGVSSVITTVPTSPTGGGFACPINGIEWITVDKQASLAQAEWFGMGDGTAMAVTVWQVLFVGEN